MTSAASTINNRAMNAEAVSNAAATLAAAAGGRRRMSRRASRNMFRMIAVLVIGVFLLVGLSAYTASLQHANNEIARENELLQAEIGSLNSQIVEATKVTRIERVATHEYGMVFPTSANCIRIDEEADTAGNLAAVIKSEAYN